MILDAATADGSTILESYLDNLLNVLFPQVRTQIYFKYEFGNKQQTLYRDVFCKIISFGHHICRHVNR